MTIYRAANIPELEKKRDKYLEQARAIDKKNYHKDYYGNGPYDRYDRTCDIIELLQTYNTVEETDCGLLLINNRFYFANQKKKWRVIGRNKWYRGYPPNKDK